MLPYRRPPMLPTALQTSSYHLLLCCWLAKEPELAARRSRRSSSSSCRLPRCSSCSFASFHSSTASLSCLRPSCFSRISSCCGCDCGCGCGCGGAERGAGVRRHLPCTASYVITIDRPSWTTGCCCAGSLLRLRSASHFVQSSPKPKAKREMSNILRVKRQLSPHSHRVLGVGGAGSGS